MGTIVETDIPPRLDRLPWFRFHTLVVAALGVTWILDGLEVTPRRSRPRDCFRRAGASRKASGLQAC
jgi:hypothetical protein